MLCILESLTIGLISGLISGRIVTCRENKRKEKHHLLIEIYNYASFLSLLKDRAWELEKENKIHEWNEVIVTEVKKEDAPLTLKYPNFKRMISKETREAVKNANQLISEISKSDVKIKAELTDYRIKLARKEFELRKSLRRDFINKLVVNRS